MPTRTSARAPTTGRAGRPRKTPADRVLADLNKTLAAQERDLASVEHSTLPYNVTFADQCRGAISRTQSAIREVEEKGLPPGWEDKWGQK